MVFSLMKLSFVSSILALGLFSASVVVFASEDGQLPLPVSREAEQVIAETKKGHPPNTKYSLIFHEQSFQSSRADFVSFPVHAGAEKWVCEIPKDVEKHKVRTISRKERNKLKQVSEENNAATAKKTSQPSPKSKDKAKHSPAAAVKALEGRCYRKAEGYWVFEVCPGRKVRQFHVEGPTITTEYSLGDFTARTEAPAEESASGGSSMVAQAAVVEDFKGGTNCDETNTGRRSIVGYVCAPSEGMLQDIQEADTCVYKMVIATSAACRPKDDTTAKAGTSEDLTGTAKKNAASATSPNGQPLQISKPLEQVEEMDMDEVLARLSKACFVKVDGWWTYEVCVGTSIRQYHKDNKGNIADGNEFQLGFFNGMKSDKEPSAPKGKSGPRFQQEYDNGTPCDVRGETKRRATLSFECKQDAEAFISSVKESVSCEYNVVLTSPHLCKHPAFKPVQDVVCPIECFLAKESE